MIIFILSTSIDFDISDTKISEHEIKKIKDTAGFINATIGDQIENETAIWASTEKKALKVAELIQDETSIEIFQMKKLGTRKDVTINIDWLEKEIYFRNHIKKLVIVTRLEFANDISSVVDRINADNSNYFKAKHVLHLTA